MSGGSPATDFAVALLREFVALGVREIVLCPGSRSQALALAAAEFERAGLARLRVRIDERVAGFLALGLAVESGTPVLVITTSGTAVANLHPAVLEARHSGVPLILLSADRPLELRGIGSNQTTDQHGIFGSAVHFMRDVEAPSVTGFAEEYPRELAGEAWSAAVGHSSAPGPVQLNLAFREPLSGVVDVADLVIPQRAAAASVRRLTVAELDASENTIVIAGHGAGPRAEEFARELGVPLVAEISSGSRFGPNLVIGYRELLAHAEFGGRVRRAIVFGHPTLSREVPALLQRDDVEMIVVRGPGFEDYNPGRRASRIVDAVSFAGLPAIRAWLGAWVQASRELLESESGRLAAGRGATTGFDRAQLAVYREPVSRRMLVEAVWRATWPHDRLIFGASRLIRDADRIVTGKKISVHANRGLAGIDGTVATGIGIALASELGGTQGVTRVVLGDLTLLHDVGALLFGGIEPRPRVQVIVGNDGGGTIFDRLEVASSAPADALDRVLYTPQAVDLGSLAAAYDWEYFQATNRGTLEESLAASAGPTLIEVPLPRG